MAQSSDIMKQEVAFNPSFDLLQSIRKKYPLFIDFLKVFQSVHNSRMFCVIMFYVILFPLLGLWEDIMQGK